MSRVGQSVSTSVATLAVAALIASAARGETLADAVTLAYQTNPVLQTQRAQLRAVNENYVQARAAAGVQISAQATAADEQITNTQTDRTLRGQSLGTSLTVSQPLFAGGRIAAAIDAARAEVLTARERLRQTESDLLQRVITAYSAVRRDQQILLAAQAAAQVLEEQLTETQAKVDVRENTRTDLALAQARLGSARSQLASYEAQLAFSRAQYLNAVGQNPGELAPEPDLPGLPDTVDEAFSAAEANNPTLEAAKRTEQVSRARVNQAKGQHLPTVSLRLQAARTPNTQYSPDPYLESLTAQAVVSQPLFTSGLNASGVRRAQELNNADRLTIDATRRNVVQTLAQQWAQLAAARLAVAADRATITAAETAFFGTRQEERFGLRSTIEVLNAQQELTSAQIGLLRNRYSEFTARAGILNSMGALTAALIVPGIATYDPEVDFDRVKNRYALPTEYVVRALDGLVAPGLGEPMAARETAVPDQQRPLPPVPSDDALRAPLRSAAEIMSETRAPPRSGSQ